MKKTLLTGLLLVAAASLFVAGFLAYNKLTQKQNASLIEEEQPTKQNFLSNLIKPNNAASTTITAEVTANQKVLTDTDLLALADNKYANGVVSLGDNKYVTDTPKKGYIYLCNVHKEQGGAGNDGPWIQGGTWNFLNKTIVSGSITWSNAQFTNTVKGTSRVLAGNGLPISHTTGIYPIQSSDPAYKYDRNPNSIAEQNLTNTLPLTPTYSDTPYCMGGEVGRMLTGVPLFNGFDAGLRDAPAHELQDSCDGHPQSSGEYHYHSLSRCFKDTSVKTVLGYALDGFPITGPMVAKDKYLTTEDLDECHGITSEVVVDGKKTVTYHYVMTQDFPYSASCFRSKAVQPAGMGGGMKTQSSGTTTQQTQQTRQATPQQGQPPQEAITACNNKSQGASCSFTTPDGHSVTGNCQTPPGSSLACVPGR